MMYTCNNQPKDYEIIDLMNVFLWKWFEIIDNSKRNFTVFITEQFSLH